MQRIRVIDSHTGGEPTRLIIDGGPDLGNGPLSVRRSQFASRYDYLRSAVVNEPRGSDVLVGALLCTPEQSHHSAGVIFFNNVGYLGMCGHGTIGLLASLAYLGLAKTGVHTIETPVGSVRTTLHDDGRVSVLNIPSYRFAHAVSVDVAGLGKVHGDIAYGGNWFFIVDDHGLQLTADNIPALTDVSIRIRQALEHHGIRGADDAVIDHIELGGPSPTGQADARGFVLCPGLAYDRSPCGTGTSAKLACLYADGKLKEGQIWRQESIIGSVFEARLLRHENQLLPEITGRAYVTADSTLLLDEHDPFRCGFTA